VAGKLHTGRSRNDQAATDTRLWLKRQIVKLRRRSPLCSRSSSPKRGLRQRHHAGYTHLQQAQPVRFAHWLLIYGWMLQRDKERLDDLTRRVDVLRSAAGPWRQSIGY